MSAELKIMAFLSRDRMPIGTLEQSHTHQIMKALTAALTPILLQFLNSPAIRELVVDLLAAYAKTTGNKIDDGIVAVVADALGVEK